MLSKRFLYLACAAFLVCFGTTAAVADRDHDRELHDWYRSHYDRLPPGLAKRDELPPGLERQLVVRGTLPPGLQKKMQPCPVEVEEILPPPPVGYMHTVIGGHIALVNRKTFLVLDIFHFEM